MIFLKIRIFVAFRLGIKTTTLAIAATLIKKSYLLVIYQMQAILDVEFQFIF